VCRFSSDNLKSNSNIRWKKEILLLLFWLFCFNLFYLFLFSVRYSNIICIFFFFTWLLINLSLIISKSKSKLECCCFQWEYFFLQDIFEGLVLNLYAYRFIWLSYVWEHNKTQWVHNVFLVLFTSFLRAHACQNTRSMGYDDYPLSTMSSYR